MVIWLAIFILIVAGIAWLVMAVAQGDTQTGAGVVGTGATLLGLALFVMCCFTVISSGHVGVPVLFGKVQNYHFDEGMHLCNPFVSVEEMSVRTESYTMSGMSDVGEMQGNDAIVALSSNGLRMSMDATVPYRLNPSAAGWVYRNLGPTYVNDILRPASRTGVRSATSKFTDQECYATKRDELADEMRMETQRSINNLVEQYGDDAPKDAILVSSVMLRNVELPNKVKEAIERKLQADQEQQQMDFQIQREEKEAKRKEIEARGIQKFQDIVSEGITPDLLRWKGIEATLKLSESPNAKVIVIGGGDGMPIILNGDQN